MVNGEMLQDIVVFVVIAAGSIIIAVLLSNLIRRYLDRRTVGVHTSLLLSRAVRYIIIGFGLYYGVYVVLRLDLTALIASLGIITLIIAFSSQQVLQNFIAGIIISLEKPMELEDIVEILPDTGVCKVKAINIMNTVVRKEDGKLMYVPNLTILNSKIINYTRSCLVEITIRVEFPVASDLERIRTIMLDALRKTFKSLEHEEGEERSSLIRQLIQIPEIKRPIRCESISDGIVPQVLIAGITPGSVIFELKMWVDRMERREEYVSSVMERVVGELQKEGIQPFRKMEVMP